MLPCQAWLQAVHSLMLAVHNLPSCKLFVAVFSLVLPSITVLMAFIFCANLCSKVRLDFLTSFVAAFKLMPLCKNHNLYPFLYVYKRATYFVYI